MHLLNFVELRSVRTTSAFVVCFHSIQYPLGVYWVSCICRYMSSKGGILVLYDVTVAMLVEIKAYPLGIEFIICWISFFSEMSIEKSTFNSSLVVKRGCAFPMSLLWGVTISFVCLFFCLFLDLKPWRPLSFRERSGDWTRFQRRKNHQPRELQTSNRLGPWYLLAETVQACTIDQSCWNGLFAGV